MKKQILFVAALLLGTTTFAQTGGPDIYGYSYKSSDAVGGPTYSWIEISTSGIELTNASNGDDTWESIGIQSFLFPFYGNNYNSVSVQTNGTIGFDDTYIGSSNVCMPGVGIPSIALFWDNLDPSSQGNIYTQDFGTYFVIQYQDVVEFGGTDGSTFQVILYKSGVIKMQFKKTSAMQANGSYTTGIQGTSLFGLSYLCDGSGDAISNNLAISFYLGAYTGITESEKPALSIFPNPSKGEFNLNIPSSSADILVKITDIQGKIVYTNLFNTAGVNETISLDAPAGIYYITADDGISIITEKIIVF